MCKQRRLCPLGDRGCRHIVAGTTSLFRKHCSYSVVEHNINMHFQSLIIISYENINKCYFYDSQWFIVTVSSLSTR
uniref:Uncharacterized protein n=1 Tax=Anguilla anguilla TaxID=7936 RepID=A0A0E9WW14_ANGAN